MSRQDCKVFIGGLSWETSDQKLRAYFENYGAVQEAFVSYDRNTGRPRGFGFVVFESSEIADKVVATKHTIDRREVEAKKAVPKDENQSLKQANGSQNSKTKKIFVGGLPPSVDEKVLRQYFEQFGGLEDAVVMYDHENKRPRGFGFITFVEEDSVEKVFNHGPMQSIHEKQIEIKPAVPRDQMPPVRRNLTFPNAKPFSARSPTFSYPQPAAGPGAFRPFHPQHGPHHAPLHPHMIPEQLGMQHPPRTSTAMTTTAFGTMPTLPGLPGMPPNMSALGASYGMSMDAYNSMAAASASSTIAGHAGNSYNYVDVHQLAQGLNNLSKLGRMPENPTVKAFTGLPAGLTFEHFNPVNPINPPSMEGTFPAHGNHPTHPTHSTQHAEAGSLGSSDPEIRAYDINTSAAMTIVVTAGMPATTTGYQTYPENTFTSTPAPGWSS